MAPDVQQLACGLMMRGIVDMDDAHEMAVDTVYRLAKQAYEFDKQ